VAKQAPFCTVLVLLYGNFHELHRRCLESIVATIPPTVQLRVGLNEVCDETLEWLERGHLDPQMLVPGTLQAGNIMRGIEQSRTLLYSSRNQNLKKYPMMRRMLWEDKLTTPWVVWFDDDSYVAKDSPWWSELEKMVADSKVMYLGQPWWVHYLEGQWDYIRSRPWFRGMPPQLHDEKPGVGFHTGGFVAIRTTVLKKLKWPDKTLVHNGGDTLLSEAIRQQGWHINRFPTKEMGVHVNASARRGYNERPAGSKVDTRR
jgi:hypothetical protein